MQYGKVIQVFTVMLTLILAIIFYFLLTVNILTSYARFQEFFVPLILIIVAIILLAILSVVSRISDSVERPRKGK